MPLRRSGTLTRSILIAAALLAGVSGVAADDDGRAPTELILGHVNDLFAGAEVNDDLYTTRVTVAVRHRDWEFALVEDMFTDRFVNGIRFDETYLTVAREFTPGAWVLRAEAGVARVGEGVYGEDVQNWIHRLFNQNEYFLSYVEDGTHAFVGLRASRPIAVAERFNLTPIGEHEYAGFKRHTLVALAADYEIGVGFTAFAEAGYRWTGSDFAALDNFIEDDDPSYGVGMSYRRWFDIRWTKNFFGTGSNHWHLLWRIPLKKNSGKSGVTD